MRKLLLGSVALFALSVGSPAVAADMPVKARPLPPPLYNWSGCYGGGSIGYKVGRVDVDYGINGFNPALTGAQATDRIHQSGAIGTLGGGCQYQGGWWLIGFEVDASATNLDGQRPEFGAANFNFQVKETWLATARLRLGYAADKWLFFITGGGAWARFDVSDWCGSAGPGCPAANFQTQNVHDVYTHGGWTVGAGWEYALGYGWSFKSEFLYVEFDKRTSFTPTTPVALAEFVVKERQYIYRVGINYKFDLGKAPVAVMAKY
jgi:outer membrane immunogenic protein